MFSAKPRLTHSTPHPNPHRIRSLLARAPEWVNSASREQTAASLAVGSRLREALEHRKSVLLRKNDLFALCRLWRYKSNLWQSRKDRPARAIRGAGAVVLAAAPVPAPQGAPSPLLPAGLSTFPLGAPDSIAAVSREHLALVGTSLTEVRRLTAASVAAFSEPCPSAQCANMQLLPASSLDLITRFMGASDPKLSYAISALSDLSSKLAVAHMNMETRLLQLTPAERKSPAWQVLGAREAPWEVYLRDIATLAAFAVSNCEHTTLEASARAVGFTPPEVALLHRDSVVASALIPCASDDAVFRGGSFVQQLSVVLASILTTAKMFPYETYLEITSLLLSKSSAHAAACMHALCTRRDTVRNTMSELRSRHGGGAPMLPSTTERLQIECL